MNNDVFFPETYRNCCKIPHWISSIIICCLISILETIILITCIYAPNIFEQLYKIGGTKEQFIVTTSLLSGLQLLSNIMLAIGISHDWALFLLIWMIVSILFWNVHLILCLAALVLHSYRTDKTSFDSFRLSVIYSVQLLWLILIVMIGRHWFALCEEIYAQEYGSYPRRQRRLLTLSNRSYRPISHYSTRMPIILSRLERNY